ncbi:Uncharacterised protein [Mycobacteroides abscessus subsp. abscessus]|nr:Uncharacterised protein [Mycobacteroides abscessus subsp. abscessus]
MEAELRSAAAEYSDQLTVCYGAEVTGVEQDEDGVTVTATDPATGRARSYRTRHPVDRRRLRGAAPVARP